MSRVCPSQMKKLLDLLSEDGILIKGKVVYTNTNYQSFWKRIALQLNAVEGGVYKSAWKWCKTWADWKNKTKKKANILLRRKNYNMECSAPPLTKLELRLLKTIDYPVDGRTDPLQIEKAVNKMEELDTTAVELEFLDENYSHLQNKEKIFTDDEKIDEYNNKSKSKYCDFSDTLNVTEDLNDNGECYSSGERKAKVKSKGKLYKKKRLSLKEYKMRTTLEMEKERAQQKSEELRLRALELKLKGEELRLKEIEMNKINYLTNIEEEKLKCFREISSSLKDLLQRNRMGTLSLNNSL